MALFLGRINLVRDKLGHPTKPEIQDWVDFKALEFVREESKGYRWNPAEWLGRYLYTDIHDILFSELPIMLHEWFYRFATHQRKFQGGALTKWNPQLIQ